MKKELFNYTKLNLNEVFSDFYNKILSSPDMAIFFDDENQIHELIAKQKEFLLASIMLNDKELRERYIHLGELHHTLKVPFSDFVAATDFLQQGVVTAIAEDASVPNELFEQTFTFFKFIKAYTAKGYLNLILESDIRDIDTYLSKVNSSGNIDTILATERILWLKNIIFAIQLENRSAAPAIKTPPESIDIIKVATRHDENLQSYALDMTHRIELTARNIFFFIEKKSYGEVLPLYKELMSIYKLTLMLVNVLTVITVDTELESSATDPLTGLRTRRSMTDLINREVTISTAANYPLSFVMVDIDFFKKVNDTYGHVVGDSVLQSVAKLILSCIRTTDHAFRFGGEEFLIVLKGATLDAAYSQAENIRKEVEDSAFNAENVSFNVTVSAGVVSFLPPYKLTIEEMTDSVDKKLYSAKTSGRNKVVK